MPTAPRQPRWPACASDPPTLRCPWGPLFPVPGMPTLEIVSLFRPQLEDHLLKEAFRAGQLGLP